MKELPHFRAATLLAIAGLLTGCAGHQQSSIDSAGPQSGRIETLFWLFSAVLGAIFLVVMAYTLLRAEAAPSRH